MAYFKKTLEKSQRKVENFSEITDTIQKGLQQSGIDINVTLNGNPNKWEVQEEKVTINAGLRGKKTNNCFYVFSRRMFKKTAPSARFI